MRKSDNNSLSIPQEAANEIRFKEKTTKKNNSKLNLIRHLDSVSNKLRKGKDLTVELAKEILESDYEIYSALMKDQKMVDDMNDMRVDYKSIRGKLHREDEFDLD